MRRRGRRADRPPVVVRGGDRVIDARVRARLLGLPLLDIDAQIVVATAREGTEATLIGPDERARRPVRTDGAAPPGLAHAVRLLAEGSSALDAARRLR
jgi:hypothetical protein